MTKTKKCPVCAKKKDWMDYPLSMFCEKHKKQLYEILSGKF